MSVLSLNELCIYKSWSGKYDYSTGRITGDLFRQ
jgi:hypothetical protein